MNLADPGVLKSLLGRHNLSASKGLGQHFLVSAKAVSLIVDAFQEIEGILEIGPGPGVLTSPLAEKGHRVIALELDPRMLEVLGESAPSAEVRQTDALKSDLAQILAELPEPRGLVSNLPYYITGPLLTRISEARGSFSKAVLMMQREVAERVVAKPKTPARGSLSVYLQLQFQIRLVAQVPAGAFLPPPKVDSTVLEFLPIGGQNITDATFRLIRLGFAQPRKTLANNLANGYHQERADMLALLDRAGLGEKARPQELTNEEWLRLGELVEAEGAGSPPRKG